MSTHVKHDDIIRINEAYLRIGTYSGVARELGYSPATVKKYVSLDYVSQDESFIKPPSNLEELESRLEQAPTAISELKSEGILVPTDEEKLEIYKVWSEMSI
jgi:hypothetical protein